MAAYSHILLAVDFSDGSQAAAEKAAQLAELFDARLSLVHVVEFLGLGFNPEFPILDGLELEKRLIESAGQRLRELAQKLGHADAGIQVEVGSPKHEICRVAEEDRVDLIVVGSHGRHGLQLLLGSTANGVLHLAPCDVLAVSVGK